MTAIAHLGLKSQLHLRLRSVADWQCVIAVLYIAAAAMPALYMAPALLVLMLLLAFVQLINLQSVTCGPKYQVPALMWILGLVLSALVSGVPLDELFTYGAVRYDANVFYSLIPLFLLGAGRITLTQLDRWIGAIAVAASCAYLLSLQIGVELFESHNAAGGYFMVLLAFLTGRTLSDGLPGRRLALATALLALLASDSRGSIIAVVAATGWTLALRYRPRLVRALAVLATVLILAILVYFHWRWVDGGSIFLYDYSEFGTVSEELPLEAIVFSERPGTILHRLFFLYPMAFEMFLQSPWIGVGFTRFDDFPLHLVGWTGLVVFNHSEVIQHTNLHAHNSYLHLAAETGVVGLWLLLRLLRAVFRSFRGSPQLSNAVSVVVGSLLFASMTEHRLTTPSQAAPVFILVGLFWACRRTGEGAVRATLPRHA